jgi:hypothetical protein
MLVGAKADPHRRNRRAAFTWNVQKLLQMKQFSTGHDTFAAASVRHTVAGAASKTEMAGTKPGHSIGCSSLETGRFESV